LDKDCSFHAAQAFLLWLIFLAVYTILVPIRDSHFAILLPWGAIAAIGITKIKVPVLSGWAEALC